MFARVSTYQGTPDRLDDAVRYIQETSDRIQGLTGFRNAYFLVDRNSGKAMTITLWESEEAVRATASAANPMRDQISQALGDTNPPTVAVYEVATQL